MFESIGKDYSTLQNIDELELFRKHMADARRTIVAYMGKDIRYIRLNHITNSDNNDFTQNWSTSKKQNNASVH